MKCHKLNDPKFVARGWHRLWCRDCRRAQHLDTMIGFGLMQMKAEPPEAQGIQSVLAGLNLQEGGRNARRASRRIAGDWLRRQARLAGVTLLVGAGWWQYMNYIPPITIPARVAPQQNAFDYFKLAGKMVTANKELGNEVAEAQQPASDPPTREHRDARLKREGKPVPTLSQLMKQKMLVDAQNTLSTANSGVWAYEAVPDKSVPAYDGKTFKMPYTLEEKQRLLDDNRLALTILREGLKYPYMDVYERRFDTLFPYYADFRQMARLLSLEADVRAAQGDWNGAMQSDLDAIQVGEKVAHGGPLIGRLVGIACEAIGQRGAWKAIEHFNAQQAKAAIARLQAIRADHAPYVETMQEEEWFTQESLRDQMRKPGWRKDFAQLTGSENSREFALAMVGWSNRIILKDMADVMDESVRRSRMSYAQSIKQGEIKEPFDPIVQVMFPVFAQARFKDVYDSETQSALLVTTLALRAYRLEHEGDLPDRLEQLTPTYLAQVPADPFANGNGPLRYHKTPVTLAVPAIATPQDPKGLMPTLYPYRLYSVGPDGRDDGGNPIDALSKPGSNFSPGQWPPPDKKNRFMVMPDRQGDIVAGVNTQ